MTLRAPRTRRRLEDELQRSAVQLLSVLFPPGQSPVIWFHVPNGGARSSKEAAILQGLGVRAGIPDLVLLWTEGCGGIELKAPTGQLTPRQKEVREQFELARILWACCRDLDQLQRVLRTWQVGFGLPGKRIITTTAVEGISR